MADRGIRESRGDGRGRRSLVLLAALVGVAAWLLLHPTVRALRSGEVDLDGRRTYVPPHGPTPEALARVDLPRVHAELLPDWVAAADAARRGRAADEPGAFARLFGEAGQDPNLASILVELRSVVVHGQDADAGRALYLLWAWEDYVGHFGHVWALEGALHRDARGVGLQLTTYRVRDTLGVRIGVAAHDVRLLWRADEGPLREAYLGATRRADEHARVVLDRIADFAVEEVWPLLGSGDDGLTPVERAWASAIRAEATRALLPEDLERLEGAVPQQRRIHDVVVAVRNRRECARERLLRRVPWAGLDEAALSHLQAVAARESGRACPSITPLETHALAIASRKLRARPGLRRAVGGLVAWTSQHVAIHEARHLADRAAQGGLDEPLDCASCPAQMSGEARGELSGQLAAIAWSGSPATAMYQACLLVHRDADAPHAEAMRLLTTRTGRPCGSGPPERLGELARTLEVEMLGRSEAIALPVGWPRRVLP